MKNILSKLYYLRGRYYNPDTKSFTTSDPAEADARLYAYAGYDPINFIDPSGYIIVSIPGTKLGVFTSESFDTITYYSESDLYELYSILQLQSVNMPQRDFIRKVFQNIKEAAQKGRKILNDAQIAAKQALRKKVTSKASIKAFDLIIDMIADAAFKSLDVAKVTGIVAGKAAEFAIENAERLIETCYLLSTGRHHESEAARVQDAIDNMKGIFIIEKGTSYQIHTCPISQVREYSNKYKQYKIK